MGQVQIYDRPPSQHLTTPPKPPLSSPTNGTLDSSTPLEEDNGRIQIHVKLVTPNSIFPRENMIYTRYTGPPTFRLAWSVRRGY